jgi:hypothetical protein
LQYNLVGEYVERANVGRRIGLLDPPEAALLRNKLWGIVDAVGVAVAKTHHAVSGVVDYGGAEKVWPELREAGLLAPVYSVRDWRDVAFSMSRKFGSSSLAELFESPQWRENLLHLEAWLDMDAHVQRYERLNTDPEGALRDLVPKLGLPWSEGAAREAAEAAGLDAQRAVAEGLAEGEDDPRHLVHWNHVAHPDGGAWREAWDEEELALSHAKLGPLAQRFGYLWD